ncbi:MAG: hypothetical protein ABL967_20625 [Bryobacteraceae bacterium]
MVTLFYEIGGAKSLKPFSDAATAMHFAVCLVQTGEQEVGQISVRSNDGDTLFSHDDISRVSRIVRLA